jgi:hypothetical protein
VRIHKKTSREKEVRKPGRQTDNRIDAQAAITASPRTSNTGLKGTWKARRVKHNSDDVYVYEKHI